MTNTAKHVVLAALFTLPISGELLAQGQTPYNLHHGMIQEHTRATVMWYADMDKSLNALTNRKRKVFYQGSPEKPSVAVIDYAGKCVFNQKGWQSAKGKQGAAVVRKLLSTKQPVSVVFNVRNDGQAFIFHNGTQDLNAYVWGDSKECVYKLVATKRAGYGMLDTATEGSE